MYIPIATVRIPTYVPTQADADLLIIGIEDQASSASCQEVGCFSVDPSRSLVTPRSPSSLAVPGLVTRGRTGT